MKSNTLVLSIAIAATTAACNDSQATNADPAQASGQRPAAYVRVTAEPSRTHVSARAIDHQGKQMGEPRVVQLTPEAGDPSEMGFTPVPAAAD
jgi:hypothetical protein